ncbi:serine/threonine protein kinase [Streptomyces carpaticus]|uniref:serine/threonine protein kinase n=1 Tax=Streptomyces carpaticus TaxID=285558 RepID=UPI003D15D1B7
MSCRVTDYRHNETGSVTSGSQHGEADSAVAERSTATSPPQRTTREAEQAAHADTATPPAPSRATEPHSGHRLAKRYRLEECITRLDGFSSWRAVDEKLRRAVGVHVLPADHDRAASVISAARSSALLGDPRFVQVLDAVEETDVVWVIHEWLPDATPLSTVLQSGPLDAHEAHALVSQVSQAMAASHREGLAHLRLTPATVLRTGTGQFRIRGLAVDAALRGISSEHPQRTDTEAIGALLYAALTQRWPYGEGGYGLNGVTGLSKSSKESLAAPDQVRAGVHRGLSELAMRAMVNDGATATSQQQPCTTPEELSRAIAALPRIPAPEPPPVDLAGYQRTTYQRGSLGAGSHGAPLPQHAPPPPAPPTLPGRTGAALKWGVSALLIAALALASWQLADALLEGDAPPDPPAKSAPPVSEEEVAGPELYPIVEAVEFDPAVPGGSQNPEAVPNAFDGDPDTFWHTKNFYGYSTFGNLKDGLGLILDLGEPKTVETLTVQTVGDTALEFRAAGPAVTTRPSQLDDFELVAQGSGSSHTLTAEEPVTTRFILVWMTDLPMGSDGNYRGRISEITVSG